MDVVGLKDAAQVRLVRLALPQALEGRLLVAEGFQEREGELLPIERPLGQRGDRLLNLDGVHGPSGTPRLLQSTITSLRGARAIPVSRSDEGADFGENRAVGLAH